MPIKFSKSKFDISNFQRKVNPAKPGHVIRREVLPLELRHRLNQARAKVLEIPIVKKTYRPIFQIVSFGLSVFILIMVLQGLSYLSSANKAKGEILGVATSAYADLHSASSDLSGQNFASAQQLFSDAENNINLAQNKLNDFRPLTWISSQASSANHVLAGAGFLALAGSKLTQALSILNDQKVTDTGIQTVDLIQEITDNRQQLSESRDLIKQASGEFQAVGSLPLDYSDTLNTAKLQVGALGTILDKLVGLEDLYLDLFTGQKTYMLIFQNTDEERATGGFIGTYGVIDTNQGLINRMKIESIYQLDGQIFEQIAAPGPLQPLIPRWGIRDANWFVDFPQSARKILSFFESGSQSADGVLSATPQFFEDILRLVGPIQMDQYDVTLTADNFQQIIQYETSVNYDKTLNQPKKFLADFAPMLLGKLSHLGKPQWLDILQIFQTNLNNRSLMLYSKDATAEAQIQNLGLGGQVLATDKDYLSINNSNLGGTKTDLNMDESVTLQSKILSDGSILNSLSIVRKNTAAESNKDYMRILVPNGSQFIGATGFDDYPYHDSTAPALSVDPDLSAWDKGSLKSNVYIRTEAGKTEFAGWSSTDPGHEQTMTISYMLPFKLDSSYSLLVQKQPGSKPFQFSGSLDLGNQTSSWLGDGVTKQGSKVEYSSNSNTDDFWPLVITK